MLAAETGCSSRKFIFQWAGLPGSDLYHRQLVFGGNLLRALDVPDKI